MKHNIIAVVGIYCFVIGIAVRSFHQYIIEEKRKKYNRFCIKNCLYLNPIEDNQTEEKEHHYCDKYSERLYHRGNHPKIVKCRECK